MICDRETGAQGVMKLRFFNSSVFSPVSHNTDRQRKQYPLPISVRFRKGVHFTFADSLLFRFDHFAVKRLEAHFEQVLIMLGRAVRRFKFLYAVLLEICKKVFCNGCITVFCRCVIY